MLSLIIFESCTCTSGIKLQVLMNSHHQCTQPFPLSPPFIRPLLILTYCPLKVNFCHCCLLLPGILYRISLSIREKFYLLIQLKQKVCVCVNLTHQLYGALVSFSVKLGVINSPYLLGLLQGLNELIQKTCLKFLVHSKGSIHVNCQH